MIHTDWGLIIIKLILLREYFVKVMYFKFYIYYIYIDIYLRIYLKTKWKNISCIHCDINGTRAKNNRYLERQYYQLLPDFLSDIFILIIRIMYLHKSESKCRINTHKQTHTQPNLT